VVPPFELKASTTTTSVFPHKQNGNDGVFLFFFRVRLVASYSGYKLFQTLARLVSSKKNFTQQIRKQLWIRVGGISERKKNTRHAGEWVFIFTR
jgi:hypothetical protein